MRGGTVTHQWISFITDAAAKYPKVQYIFAYSGFPLDYSPWLTFLETKRAFSMTVNTPNQDFNVMPLFSMDLRSTQWCHFE